METATFGNKTVILPSKLIRVFALSQGERIQFCNGWGYTALVMVGETIVGYCCLKNKLDSQGNWAGKELDPTN